MPEHAPAYAIKVDEFRQILAWPFVMPGDRGNGATGSESRWFDECVGLLDSGESKWKKMRTYNLMRNRDTGIYEEANRFHDYISDTLFNDHPENILAFRRKNLRAITFYIRKTENDEPEPYCFEVPFNSMHIYKCGVAILTLELRYVGRRLALDETQMLVHRLRRTNPPFWLGPGSPAFCPERVEIHEEFRDVQEMTSRKLIRGLEDLNCSESARNAICRSKCRPYFSWWREILRPLYPGGSEENAVSPLLGQIMDERIPALTTICLEHDRNRSDALNSVSDEDWLRIAEGVEEGVAVGGFAPDVREVKLKKYVYDRYMPSVGESRDVAARFTFAFHHFAAVVAGGSRDLNIPEQIRSHYRHMHHLCLLELAAVLRISQQLYQDVNEQDSRKNHDSEALFRNNIRDMQEAFMEFTHRHHFTGISNDLQAREIFTAFRDSMELDKRYSEIKDELDSAANLALAKEQMEVAKSTHQLTEIATLAAVILVAAALAERVGVTFMKCRDCTNMLSWTLLGRIPDWVANWSIDGWSFGIWLLITSVGSSLLFRERMRKSRALRRYIFSAIAFAALIVFFSVLSCCPFNSQ